VSKYSGVDISAAPILAQSLRSLDLQLDDVLSMIRQAETMSQILTGVHGALDSVGADGSVMASAVDRAVSQVEDFRIDLSTFEPRLLTPAPGSLWGQFDSDKQAVRALLQDTGKELATSPVGQAQISGAQDEIEQAFIAGRDTQPAIDRYRELLGEAIGDPSAPALAAAMSFMSQGVPVREVGPQLTQGPDALFGRLAAAMEAGTDPAQTDLNPAFFPVGYADWHEHDALETRYHAALWALDSDPGMSIAGEPLQAVVDQLPELWPERRWLQAMLDGRDVPPGQVDRVRSLVGSFVQRQLDDLGPRPAGLVDTLHGQAQIDDLGRVTPFEAIGAAASTVSPPSPTYVGDSYAQFYSHFRLAETEQAAGYLAGDSDTAVAFFESLGADGAARLLPDVRFEDGPLGHGPVSQDISRAFGLASAGLPTDFGADVVRAGHELPYELWSPLVAEHLFAHGTFEPHFLTSAAVASLGDPGRASSYVPGLDPRMIMLATVARQELGVDFVHALVNDGALDAFVWPSRPFDESLIDGQTPSDMPIVSQLLVQAAINFPASRELVATAGAQQGPLDIDIANGLSAVVAGNLRHYRLGHSYLPPDPRLLVAAENVFAAGAGIDIELASRALLTTEVEDSLLYRDDDWWYGLSWPTMVGHLEAAKYLADSRMALAGDEAIRNTNLWLSRISTEGGAVLGALCVCKG